MCAAEQDSFLVSKMDKEYFVELSVLADFHLLKVLTTDEKLISEAIKSSKKVCVLVLLQKFSSGRPSHLL